MSAFVHMELSTDDPTAAKAFYKKLFGWKLKDQQMPNGVYTTFDTRTGGPGGGITAKTMPGQPTAWLPYVGVKSPFRARHGFDSGPLSHRQVREGFPLASCSFRPRPKAGTRAASGRVGVRGELTPRRRSDSSNGQDAALSRRFAPGG